MAAHQLGRRCLFLRPSLMLLTQILCCCIWNRTVSNPIPLEYIETESHAQGPDLFNLLLEWGGKQQQDQVAILIRGFEEGVLRAWLLWSCGRNQRPNPKFVQRIGMPVRLAFEEGSSARQTFASSSRRNKGHCKCSSVCVCVSDSVKEPKKRKDMQDSASLRFPNHYSYFHFLTSETNGKVPFKDTQVFLEQSHDETLTCQSTSLLHQQSLKSTCKARFPERLLQPNRRV